MGGRQGEREVVRYSFGVWIKRGVQERNFVSCVSMRSFVRYGGGVVGERQAFCEGSPEEAYPTSSQEV